MLEGGRAPVASWPPATNEQPEHLLLKEHLGNFGRKVGWHSITLYITQGWHSITAHADAAQNNNPPAAVTKHEKLDLLGNEEEAFDDPQDFEGDGDVG